MLLLSLAIVVGICSTYGNQMRESLPTTLAAISPSHNPAPSATETAQIKLTRIAFDETVDAQIDLMANALLTRMPTQTPTLTPVPRDTLTAPFTPVAAMMATLDHPATTTDDVLTLMLRLYTHHNSSPFYFYVNAPNAVDIEVAQDTIGLDWSMSDAITNDDKTLLAFLSWPPQPTNSPVATVSVEEFVAWQKAGRLLVKDLQTGSVYWFKSVYLMPARPVELEGWVTNDIFVISEFGSPWHGFLSAIDARKHKSLMTIQLEF